MGLVSSFNGKTQKILLLLQRINKMHSGGWIRIHCDNTKVASLIKYYPILILNSLILRLYKFMLVYYLFSVRGKTYINTINPEFEIV